MKENREEKNLKQEERFEKKEKKEKTEKTKKNEWNHAWRKFRSKRANRQPKMSKNSELKQKKLGLVPENVQCYVLLNISNFQNELRIFLNEQMCKFQPINSHIVPCSCGLLIELIRAHNCTLFPTETNTIKYHAMLCCKAIFYGDWLCIQTRKSRDFLKKSGFILRKTSIAIKTNLMHGFHVCAQLHVCTAYSNCLRA